MSEEEIVVFSDRKTQVTYLSGETIIKQGAFANNVLFINEGLVRQFIQPGVNRQMNLRLMKTGDFMAFFTIFGGAVYPYSAVALKDTTVCMIEKEMLREMLARNSRFASITLESAIKFIKEFEKEEMLQIDAKKIKITDKEALEKISLIA